MNSEQPKPTYEIHHTQQPRKDGRAVASMVLGICSLVFPFGGVILAIIGLVLGRISINQSGDSGMAKAGVVMSIISLCLYLAVPLLIFVFIVIIPTILALIAGLFAI